VGLGQQSVRPVGHRQRRHRRLPNRAHAGRDGRHLPQHRVPEEHCPDCRRRLPRHGPGQQRQSVYLGPQ